MKKKTDFLKKAKEVAWKVYPFLKNKYVVTVLIFFFWMLFFDRNDIISRVKLQSQVNKLKKEKKFYENEIREINEANHMLFSDDESLEKFAREKYLMKRDNEEIFLIVDK